MDKLACRTYGIIWLLYGALCLVAVSLLIVVIALRNISGCSVASNVGAAEIFLILATFTAIVVAVGVFAYLRYISAMIVGCISLLISVIAIQNIGASATSDVDIAATLLIVATFTTIVITVGVFAYLRYVSAVIVGCLVWMFPLAAVDSDRVLGRVAATVDYQSRRSRRSA
jgi:hypothetical protein